MSIEIDPKEIEISVISAVDTAGVVFKWNEKIFRAIHSSAAQSIRELFTSGLMSELMKNKLVPNSWISDYRLPGYSFVIEHNKIDPVTFPHEWSFDMLKDAALVTLEVNEVAAKYGYQTKDGHPFNVLFDGVTPIFIDIGSFTKITEKQIGWLGIEEFYRAFYYPLKIWEHGNDYLANRTLIGGDAIPHYSYLMYRYPLIRFLRGRYFDRIVFLWRVTQMMSMTGERKLPKNIMGKVVGGILKYKKKGPQINLSCFK